MIWSFSDKDTQALFEGAKPKRYGADVRKRMLNKLQILNGIEKLEDLKVPTGNRLETLSGNREGFHSIRVNDQWRICFHWDGKNACDVEILDYH